MPISLSSRILLVATTLTLFACGKASNTNPADNATEYTKDTDLQGKVFKGECSMKPLDEVAAGIPTGGDNIKSARVQYSFVGANLTHDIFLYKSSDCSGTAALSFIETGAFRLDPKTTTGEGAKAIDITFDHLHLLVGDDVGLRIAHALNMCGTNDWSIAKDREVTPAAADQQCFRQKLPSHDATIYLLDKNTLYFGAKAPLNRSADRPTTLEKGLKYTAGQ